MEITTLEEQLKNDLKELKEQLEVKLIKNMETRKKY